MNVESNQILERALKLSDTDRALLIDRLITSLEKPNDAIDALWMIEAEQRVEGYREGRLRSVSLEQVLAKYS